MDSLLEKLLTDNLDRIYRFALNRIGDTVRAEDLAHDIITELICAYPNLRDKSRINSWMWGVARNVYLRTLYVREELSLDEDVLPHSLFADDFTEEMDRRSGIRNLRKALAFLSKNYREILVLYYIEGKSYKEISDSLSIPMSRVKWRLSKSKQYLKEEYEKMENFMSDGFRSAKNMRVTSSVYNAQNENYLIPRRALKSLLAKNVAMCAYESPITVTQISETLGVPADYVEDVLEELAVLGLLNQEGKRYQTAFPIISAELDREVREFVRSRVAQEAPAILSAARSSVEAYEGEECSHVRALYPYNSLGSDENGRIVRMLLSQAYMRTKTIRCNEFPFTEGGYYSVIGYMNMQAASDYLGMVTYGVSDGNVTERAWELTYFTSRDIGTAEYSPDAVRLMGRIYSQKGYDDIENHSEILAELLRDSIVIKKDGGYRLDIFVCDVLEYEERLLDTYRIFSAMARSVIESIEDETVELLRKRLPRSIRFHRPIAYDYMNEIYDKELFAYAAKELGITLRQRDLMILGIE